MKYNLKTAVHVTNEFTRQNLIEFFEAIKSDCNLVKNFEKDEIEVGEIWGIFNGMLEYLGNSYNDVKNLSDYTILNGVPKNWREEMNKPETDLQSKIDKLENENKELEECLELCVTELESSYRKLGYSSSNILTQAKQLLNQK